MVDFIADNRLIFDIGGNKFRLMARKNYTRSDLTKLLGSAPRASEILNGKRGLTMEQARLLHTEWDVPAETLLMG